MIRDLLNAISFLTIIPLKEREIRPGAVSYFPLVGLLIGGLISAAYILLINILPSGIAVILTMILYILLTGGLHLDGFTDTIDGLSGGEKNKERILEIMSDSHIGAHGAAGLICLLGLKFSLLYSMSAKPGIMPYFFLFMPVFGRWSMVLSMACSKPARQDGLGKLFIEHTNLGKIAAAAIFTLLAVYLAFGINGLICIFVIFLATIGLTKILSKLVGGMTGDTVGFVNEITEIIFLLYVLIVYTK